MRGGEPEQVLLVGRVHQTHEHERDRQHGQDEDRTLEGHAGGLALRPHGAQDVGKEEAVGAREQVPDSVHSGEEEQRTQVAAGQQLPHAAGSVASGSIGGRRPRLGARGLGTLGPLPDRRLGHPPAHRPEDEGNDEEVGEHDPDPEYAERRHGECHQQDDGRAEVPENLGNAAVLSPVGVGRGLGDQRPGRRDVGPDSQAGQDIAEDEHPGRQREDDPQHAEGIQQHVHW